ncbi:ABC transporter permease [Mycoplasmatota bacterium]|nr:ABC transporter permease [Mycoplasmatota bacterium]
MTKYILKRLGMAALTLLVILFILFLLLEFMPGSPFNDEKLSPDQIANLNALYGLDKSPVIRFLIFVKNVVLHQDFGISFVIKKNAAISDMISSRIGITIKIGLQAILIGTVTGIVLGVIAGIKRNTIFDTLTTIIAVLGVSIPSYVFALGLSYYFGYKMRLFPITFDIDDTVRSMVLPSIALSMFVIAQTARFMRMELIDIFKSDYIQLAESKGLSNLKVIIRHALRNAMIPVITVLGPLLVGLMTGSLVVEKIFGIPGIGSLLIQAIQVNDFNVVIAIAFIYSFLYIFVNLLVDLLYGIIDPRIRVQGGGTNA